MNLTPFFSDEKFIVYNEDFFYVIGTIPYSFDMVFADPPYFLSNGGLTIKSGKITSVDKGDWDTAKRQSDINDFNYNWLRKVREKLNDSATIWISGTYHNIFSIGQVLTELNFKILNVITWEKNNPPPNFSCRFFTHGSEIIIWARKHNKKPHYYNYELMKKINEDKQMKDVWKLPAVSKFETTSGKHPTQKPLSILSRIILSSSQINDWILDPFAGSGTTGIAATLLKRNFIGIEREKNFSELMIARYKDLLQSDKRNELLRKIQGFPHKDFLKEHLDSGATLF